MSGGVRVRGSCAGGHITETTAEKGRTTWQGVCAHDGCDLKVNARRIPRDAVPPAPAAGEHEDSIRVVRIADYDDTAHGAADDAGIVVADLEPAKPGSEGPAPDGAPADPVTDDGERRGAFSRYRERRRATAARSAGVSYRHPLGID